MKNIWDILADEASVSEKKLYTILTGEKKGEKLLLEDGKVSQRFQPDDMFLIHLKELENSPDTGCFELDGQRIFSEQIGRSPRMVVCGGGHVSAAVVRIAVMMQMEVTVVEDRPLFANKVREAGADQVLCDSYENALSQIHSDDDTYFVIVTRGHRYDQICLEIISRMPHAYIGMMGSRKRVALVKKSAMEHGCDEKIISRLHAPIGLDIHAETPEEIAVSIMAQILAEKGKKKKSTGFTNEILRSLKEETVPGVLATIISRKGSAPRTVGTKMVVFQDGSQTGTIGGGCLEAKVVTEARMLMLKDQKQMEVIQVDLTPEDAGQEGMICGGCLEVLLEKI